MGGRGTGRGKKTHSDDEKEHMKKMENKHTHTDRWIDR